MARKKKKNKKNRFFKNTSFVDTPILDEFKEIFFPYNIWKKIMGFTKQAEGEISGFGKTEIHGDTIIVEDFSIFTQDCNPAHTTLKSEDLTHMYVGVAKAGGEPEKWNLWWHSHVNMGTGFSGTDDETMTNISSNGGLIIGICTNKRNEFTTAVYKDGVKVAEDLIVRVVPEYDDAYLDELNDEIREKVTMTKFIHFKRGTVSYHPDLDLAPDYPALIMFGDGIPLSDKFVINQEMESDD